MARITGINSGLDIDALVKASMTTYQSKIDKEAQNKKVLEYQQEQYKKIISDAANFYDKYFDILKTGSLVSSSTYQTQTYTSSDGGKVTAKGLAGATLDDYTVSVTQLAAKASDTLDLKKETGTGKSIKIGSSTITFDVVSDGNTTVSNYNAAIAAKKLEYTNTINGTGTTEEKTGAQTALDYLNNNTIKAQYSEFSGKVTFAASSFNGEGFTISGHHKAEDKYLEATVKNSKGEVYTVTSADKKISNSVTVDNVVFDFKGVSSSTLLESPQKVSISALDEKAPGVPDLSSTPLKELTPLEEDGTTNKTTAADGTVTAITTSDGKITTTVTSPDKSTKVTTTQGKVTTVTDANGVTTTTDTSNLAENSKSGYTLKIVKTGSTTSTTATNYDGTVPITKTIQTVSGVTTTTTTLKDKDKTTVKQDINDGTKISTTITTEKQRTDGSTIAVEKLTKKNGDDQATFIQSTTTQLKVKSDGSTTKTVTTKDTNGTELTTGATYGTPTTLTGGTDVTALKDKIVSFVNDYNTLLSSINTKIYETRDKDYMPLSDEQKKEMTDDQIEKWETKAQTGLIRKDMDLERITSAMKSAMSTVISGSGLTLESIGIKPVANYAEKNGMFTVDESTLTKALEENAGNIKDLFTRAASGNDKKGGIFIQLAATLKSEFKSSTASLSKKAGIDGTSTQYSNTLTKSIAKKKTLIQELNDKFSVKETALYKKYSALETALEKLNSQQASLSSMLGTS